MAKKQKYGPQWTNAAEQTAANLKIAGGTPQGQYGVPGRPTPPPVPEPTGPAGGGGARGGGGGGTPIRDLYNQMGGKKGAGMDFAAFKDWYKNQSESLGGDLGQFIAQSPDLDATSLQNATYGVGASFTAGSDIENFLQPSYLSDEGELQVLNERLDQNYSSLDDARSAYALGAGMAGVEQFRQNLGEGRGNLPDYLLDVSAQDIRYDDQAWEQFYNSMMQSSDPQARAEAQQALVPEWAGAVDEALQGQVDINREGQTGVPFGFELLMDPAVNISDPNLPAWDATQGMPPSLMPLTQNQAGEGAFIAGLSMEEIMQHLWPLVQAQHHRPAGSEAPFEAGLSMGGGGVDPKTGHSVQSPIFGFSGKTSQPDPDALRLWGREPGETEDWATAGGPEGWAGGLYNRWAAHGMPGTPDYNPRWGGTLGGGNPDLTLQDYGWNQERLANMDPRMLASLEAMVQKQEEGYWDYPLYQPWQNLPEEVRKRFQALINAPLSPGGETTLTMGA